MKKKNKAIFLDRDGVINRTIIKNHKPYPPKTINKFKVYNDVKLLNNLKADFIDKGLIYIEFRNFPLDLAAFNASKIAHCKNDGKSEILHFLYSKQNEWVKGSSIEEANNNLKKVLEKQQLNLDFEKCIADKSIEDHILEDRIEGVKKYKVNATPTLIINEEKFENPSDYKKLKKYIEKLI